MNLGFVVASRLVPALQRAIRPVFVTYLSVTAPQLWHVGRCPCAAFTNLPLSSERAERADSSSKATISKAKPSVVHSTNERIWVPHNCFALWLPAQWLGWTASNVQAPRKTCIPRKRALRVSRQTLIFPPLGPCPWLMASPALNGFFQSRSFAYQASALHVCVL